MGEKTLNSRRPSIRDGPSECDGEVAGLLSTGGRSRPLQLAAAEALESELESALESGVLEVELVEGPEPPVSGGVSAEEEAASRIRPIYGFLALKLGQRIMTVLDKCSSLRQCGEEKCDIMGVIEELIAQVEDVEALISALDGLMRDVDDEKITDPRHVQSYLSYCLHLRRKGRVDARDQQDCEGGEDGCPGSCEGDCPGARGEGCCGGCTDDGSEASGEGDDGGGIRGEGNDGGGIRSEAGGGGIRSSVEDQRALGGDDDDADAEPGAPEGVGHGPGAAVMRPRQAVRIRIRKPVCTCGGEEVGATGRCACTAIRRRKELAKMISSALSERNG